MIVAAYLENILWAPVHTSFRVERIERMGRESGQSKQQKNAFASLLATAMNLEGEESNGFDSRA